MPVSKGSEEHSKRLRFKWLKRRWRRGRRPRGGHGNEAMPMSHRDLWKKIKRETKGKPPAEEIRILEGYLADWPEFKGPYQEMKKKYERRIAELRKVQRVQASHHGHRDPFAVKKRGLAEVALVGLPNSGKSSVMRTLTGVNVEIADYPYTTLMPNVGMLNLGGFAFEVIDLPPVSEGPLSELHYAGGLKEAVQNARLLMLVIDLLGDAELQLEIIRDRLREIGVSPLLAPTGSGSASGRGTAAGSRAARATTSLPLRKALVLGTKLDAAGEQALGALRDLLPDARVFGHPMDSRGRHAIGEALCGFLGKIVVIARDPDSRDEPVAYAVGSNAVVLDLAAAIHKDLAAKAKRAKVWGASATFPGQEVGLDHPLSPGDVVEIFTK